MVDQDLLDVLAGQDIEDIAGMGNDWVCWWEQRLDEALVAMLRVWLVSSASKG